MSRELFGHFAWGTCSHCCNSSGRYGVRFSYDGTNLGVKLLQAWRFSLLSPGPCPVTDSLCRWFAVSCWLWCPPFRQPPDQRPPWRSSSGLRIVVAASARRWPRRGPPAGTRALSPDHPALLARVPRSCSRSAAAPSSLTTTPSPGGQRFPAQLDEAPCSLARLTDLCPGWGRAAHIGVASSFTTRPLCPAGWGVQPIPLECLRPVSRAICRPGWGAYCSCSRGAVVSELLASLVENLLE